MYIHTSAKANTLSSLLICEDLRILPRRKGVGLSNSIPPVLERDGEEITSVSVSVRSSRDNILCIIDGVKVVVVADSVSEDTSLSEVVPTIELEFLCVAMYGTLDNGLSGVEWEILISRNIFKQAEQTRMFP